MIVHKAWHARNEKIGKTWKREGWFLFGFIPLYVMDLEYRPLT